ncbi:MAG: hydantoinase/oxoprolinase family protein, partial [Zetaproteobacteria bacterium]
MLRVGVDIGGTFTDFVAVDESGLRLAKTLSTPRDPIAAIETGLAMLGAGAGFQLVHGSTIVTNSILERKGARVLVVVNAGFEDMPLIGRQTRTPLYGLAPQGQGLWIAREDII